MTIKTKDLLREALFIWDNAGADDRALLLWELNDNLTKHYNGLKIGFGAPPDYVNAALLFLRIVKQTAPQA